MVAFSLAVVSYLIITTDCFKPDIISSGNPLEISSCSLYAAAKGTESQRRIFWTAIDLCLSTLCRLFYFAFFGKMQSDNCDITLTHWMVAWMVVSKITVKCKGWPYAKYWFLVFNKIFHFITHILSHQPNFKISNKF